MPQDELWLLEEKYGGEKSEAFFADCKRLALGEPLGYLIGWTPFLNTKIWLDSRPLIPRPETEFWVEKAIATIKQASLTTPRILDLCAGSGCIGIATAKALPEAQVDFSEIVSGHLSTIEKNLAANSIDRSRYTISHTNLFTGLTGLYDFILSNPPYIDQSLNRTELSVTKYEPYIALFGGIGGLEIIEKIIEAAPAHLTQHGQLWIEHEPEQSSAIKNLATRAGFSATTHCDQYQVERYSILVLQ